jgi:hypothetical protein
MPHDVAGHSVLIGSSHNFQLAYIELCFFYSHHPQPYKKGPMGSSLYIRLKQGVGRHSYCALLSAQSGVNI